MTNATVQHVSSDARQASVIAITSLVAGSQVGGLVTCALLQAQGIRAQLIPSVVLGRHPGLGAPGGGAVSADLMAAALEGVAANQRFHEADAILTGYFQTPEQVAVTALAIRAARSKRPDLQVLVDPILGDGEASADDAQLYVSPATAAAIRDQLLPLASVITPNRFELSWLAGRALKTDQEMAAAARAVCPHTVLTSAPASPGEAAVMLITPDEAWRAVTPHLEGAPNGTGDLFAAALLADLISGLAIQPAAGRAMARVAHVLDQTLALDPRDLHLTPTTLTATVQAPRWRRVGAQNPAWVMGLDGCKGGWAAVMVDLNGLEAPQHAVFESFQSAFDWGAQIIAVDMPIGFESAPDGAPGRACERAARQLLGPRRSSIFPSPLRPALKAQSYEQANALNRAAGGTGLSKQAYNLFPKLRELDAVLTPELGASVVFETHPETSFTVLSGRPAQHRKTTVEGRAERLSVLHQHGLPGELFEPHPYLRRICAPDDLVDAGLCALTAMRIASATARTLPEDPPRDERGLIMAIHA